MVHFIYDLLRLMYFVDVDERYSKKDSDKELHPDKVKVNYVVQLFLKIYRFFIVLFIPQ